MKWIKPINLPKAAEEQGGHKIRPVYFIVVQNQIVPMTFVWFAEKRIFYGGDIEVKESEVQACAAFADLTFPTWLERRGEG